MGLFTKAIGTAPAIRTGMTTLEHAQTPSVRQTFTTSMNNQSVGDQLADRVQTLIPKMTAALKDVQGAETRVKVLKTLTGNENALPDGSLRLMESSEYFALMGTTTHPESYRGGTWNQDQIIFHDPDELARAIDVGANFLNSNNVNPNFSPVVTALPAAGMGARASDQLMQRPDLLGLLQLHKAMEGLEKGNFPPRFMYPVRTRLSDTEIKTMTLLSLMLQSSRHISKEAGALIGSILMLHPHMANYVLNNLQKDLTGLTDQEAGSIALFPQQLSVKYQVGSGQYTGPLFPAGHGDFPSAMAQANIFNYLAEQGAEMMFYSNADEIAFAPNPIMVAASKQLMAKGYSAVVFVVRNTNGQSGGGPFTHIATNGIVLQEMPILPQDVKTEMARREEAWKAMLAGQTESSIVEPLPPISTLSLALSIPALAKANDQLIGVHPGLDVKPYGDNDQVIGLESWSGTELTLPATTDPNFRVAVVFVERTGFFTGIKIPKHVSSNFQGERDSVPPELWNIPSSSPFAPFRNMTYFQYIQYLAEKYPLIIQKMFARDKATVERLYKAGGGYLIEV